MRRLGLFAIGFLTYPGIAAAQERGFAVNRFEPSEHGSEWFTNESLDMRGHLRPSAGLGLDFNYRALVIYDLKEPDTVDASTIRNQLVANLGGTLNLWDRLRLGLNMPLVLYEFGHYGTVVDPPPTRTYFPPQHDQAFGDLRLGVDVRIAGAYGDPVTFAAGVQTFFPTGSRIDYTSDGTMRFLPRLMLAGDVGVFVYAAHLGIFVRPHDANYRQAHLGNEITGGASFGARVLDKHLVVGPELWMSTTLNGSAFDKETTPAEGLLGAHYTAGDFRFGTGVGFGFTRGYGSPATRILASLDWVPGPKEKPKPPPPPPPRTDRDGDGVFDDEDACPDTPGFRSFDPRLNGCPPPVSDRDKDGIQDANDACPDVPGVPTTDPKTNGCPPDRDKDGILDKDDACPDEPGVADADPKKNGCPPDKDRDKDGIANDQDACPDEPGPPDPDPKKNGCPKAFVQGGQIKITEQVKFKTNSADIAAKESEAVLTAILDVMTKHPEIKKVRVEGHTDNKGTEGYNKKLSQARADSVMKWLVGKGIDKNRLTAQGFGFDRPIDDNTTEAGRAANRRVELHIVE
jgi:outer membrane protein OmpA-like peptidoglycan-associated protein